MDPITFEVIRSALYAIADEMKVILMRSARSPLLQEAGDLSCALTDAEGRLIAQGDDMPIHLGVMAFTVKEFLRRVDRNKPGRWSASPRERNDGWLADVRCGYQRERRQPDFAERRP